MTYDIDFQVVGPHRYRLNEDLVYLSRRYNRCITVPAGYMSDGATCAMDITTRGWWVHDIMCDRGTWDDGTPVTRWQASSVLYDCLREDGYWIRAPFWRLATWVWGGP